jgi:hypothetical protein
VYALRHNGKIKCNHACGSQEIWDILGQTNFYRLSFPMHWLCRLQKSKHLIKWLNLYENIRYIMRQYTVKFGLLFKYVCCCFWCTDDPKAEFLMQIEIVLPISPQWGCRFMAYKTRFRCLGGSRYETYLWNIFN